MRLCGMYNGAATIIGIILSWQGLHWKEATHYDRWLGYSQADHGQRVWQVPWSLSKSWMTANSDWWCIISSILQPHSQLLKFQYKVSIKAGNKAWGICTLARLMIISKSRFHMHTESAFIISLQPFPNILTEGAESKDLFSSRGETWKTTRKTLSPSFSASKLKMVPSM